MTKAAAVVKPRNDVGLNKGGENRGENVTCFENTKEFE